MNWSKITTLTLAVVDGSVKDGIEGMSVSKADAGVDDGARLSRLRNQPSNSKALKPL